MKSGYLWLATQGGGLNRLDPCKGTVERLSKNERDPFGLESDFVKAILMRRTGDIWVASQDQGLQLYDRGAKSLYQDRYPLQEHEESRDRLAL